MNFNDKVRAMALRLIGNNNAVIEAAKPKVYIALLTQTGTDAPVATVLENTLGGVPVWTYWVEGGYKITLLNAFPTNSTFFIGGNIVSQNNEETFFKYEFESNSVIRLYVEDSAGLPTNNFIQLPIKIEVYP